MDTIFCRLRRIAVVALGIFALAACGGDGGDDGGDDNSSDSGWVAGNFLPSGTYVNQCASPRNGTDLDGNPWPDVAGSVLDENNWLRSWSHETYLWYAEIPDEDPADYPVPSDYFKILKTFATTESGKAKDSYHFSYPTDEWNALSQSGVAMGYGFQWIALDTDGDGRTEINQVYAVYSDRESWPAGVERGMRVLRVDDLYMDNIATQAELDRVIAALWPEEAVTHEFVFEDTNGLETQPVTLSAGAITLDPVQNVDVVEAAMQRKVGYMLFNDHIATAQGELRDAVAQLQQEGIDDLVLDLRYNGGGYLAIASQLAYMIAGETRTAGRTFEKLQFNDKHTEFDIFGDPIEPFPFLDSTDPYFGGGQPELLPTLNLSRVFVLTGANTCSASEAIINGLRGVGVEVIQIGETTCGKPYGFYATDNCGTTYFTIQFQGVNEEGFGDYADGFSPGAEDDGAMVTGCAVPDDFDHALGSADEARFATALHYIENGSCPSSTTMLALRSATPARVGAPVNLPEGRLIKGAWRENRIVARP